MNRDKREVRRKLRILRHAEETGRPCQYALGAPTNTCRCLRLDLPDRLQFSQHVLYANVTGLVTLASQSRSSFMRPFVQMPRGFCHLSTSAAVVDYRTH